MHLIRYGRVISNDLYIQPQNEQYTSKICQCTVWMVVQDRRFVYDGTRVYQDRVRQQCDQLAGFQFTAEIP